MTARRIRGKASRNRRYRQLAEKLRTCESYGKKTIELGRFLVSMSGYYLTRVMDVKRTAQPGFLILDGGIHQINYYGWMMGMKQPEIEVLAEKRR